MTDCIRRSATTMIARPSTTATHRHAEATLLLGRGIDQMVA